MTIDIDQKKLDAVITNFEKYIKMNARVTRTALNKASKTAKVQSLRQARDEWKGLSVADFKKINELALATNQNPETVFTIASNPINLQHFTTKKQAKSGATYKLKDKQKTLKGSFQAKGFVFKRQTKARDSIIPYFSITPTAMFAKSDSVSTYIDIATKDFEAEYLRTINSDFEFAKRKK